MTSKKSLEQRLAELRADSGDGPGFTREQLAEAWREGLRPPGERKYELDGEVDRDDDREGEGENGE